MVFALIARWSTLMLSFVAALAWDWRTLLRFGGNIRNFTLHDDLRVLLSCRAISDLYLFPGLLAFSVARGIGRSCGLGLGWCWRW